MNHHMSHRGGYLLLPLPSPPALRLQGVCSHCNRRRTRSYSRSNASPLGGGAYLHCLHRILCSRTTFTEGKEASVVMQAGGNSQKCFFGMREGPVVCKNLLSRDVVYWWVLVHA